MTGSIKVISSMATRRILDSLLEVHGQRTGCTVELKAMGGVDAARLVRAGTDADVIILASQVVEKLEDEGCILAGSRTDIARSGIAIAVRSGVRHPAIDHEDDVRQAMRDAGTICFSTGPSGDHLKSIWQRWGLADMMSRKAVQAPAGVPVGEMLARGDADLGVQQLSELLGCPGVDVVGPLPSGIQAITIFTAGIIPSSSKIAIARDLIAFLASPETIDVKRAFGMDAPDKTHGQPASP